MNVSNHERRKGYARLDDLVTIDMYRMLQAVEREQNDGVIEERNQIQSPAPTNYQQREIYVRELFFLIRMCMRAENMFVMKISKSLHSFLLP